MANIGKNARWEDTVPRATESMTDSDVMDEKSIKRMEQVTKRHKSRNAGAVYTGFSKRHKLTNQCLV